MSCSEFKWPSEKTALTSCHETNIRAKLELPHWQATVEAAVRCRLSSGPCDWAAGLQTETAFYKVRLFYMSGATLFTILYYNLPRMNRHYIQVLDSTNDELKFTVDMLSNIYESLLNVNCLLITNHGTKYFLRDFTRQPGIMGTRKCSSENMNPCHAVPVLL